MCIFSKSVTSVAATHIFARRDLVANRHVTVYQMEAMLNGATAMILPVPGDYVKFVSLEEYPDFFKDMDKLFPQNVSKGITRSIKSFSLLPVYEVGNYIATYVPSMNDWNRVDPVFRLNENCWDELPDYSEYGFVVFQLQAKNDQKFAFHPMAYTYEPNNENQIFFPTTHVHDGEVEKTSLYDHKLYFQLDDGFNHPPAKTNLRSDWEVSTRTLMDFAKCQNLVSRFSPIARIHLDKVMLPNQDIILEVAELDTVITISNKVREKEFWGFGINDFAEERHFSENSGFSYTTMSYQELIAEISKNWKNRRPGKGETSLDRKVVVPISNEKVFGVYTKIEPGMKITSQVTQRQAGEDYYIENTFDSPNSRIRNKFAKVVLYSREALLENDGSCSTDSDWEVVCLISTDVDDEPMQPLAMARNMLQKPGGTASTYSAEEFAEAIYYWSQRIKI